MGLWVVFFLVATTVVAAACLLYRCSPVYIRKEDCGRIEGVVLLDGRPASAGVAVACHLSSSGESRFERWLGKLLSCWYLSGTKEDSSTDTFLSFVSWMEHATTGADGRFVFEKIPKGVVELGRELVEQKGHLPGVSDPFSSSRGSIETAVLVKPGETTSAVLGQGGSTISGKLTVPDESGPLFCLARVREAVLIANDKSEKNDKMLDAILADRLTDWVESDAGIDWAASTIHSYHFSIGIDGTFRIDNVREGTYRLIVELDIPCEMNPKSMRPFADLTRALEVPLRDLHGDAEVYVGELPMTVYRERQPGEPCPPIADFLDVGAGEDDLDYTGKFLLVLFWHPVDDIRRAYVKALRKAYEQLRERSEVAFLVLTIDEQSVPVDCWISQFAFTVPLYLVQEERAAAVTSAFGVRDCAFFLIGPDS